MAETFNPTLAVFSTILLIIGVILSYMVIDKQTKLSSSCVSKNVQIGFSILMMLSLMMAFIPILQLFCYWYCGCPQNHISYKWIIVGISVLMIVIASMVLNGLEQEPNCNLKSAKDLMIGLIAVGSLIILFLVIVPFIRRVQLKSKPKKKRRRDDYSREMVSI